MNNTHGPISSSFLLLYFLCQNLEQLVHDPKYVDQFLTVFTLQLSQQGSFLQDDQNKGKQLYVLTKVVPYPKYLDQFLKWICF